MNIYLSSNYVIIDIYIRKRAGKPVTSLHCPGVEPIALFTSSYFDVSEMLDRQTLINCFTAFQYISSSQEGTIPPNEISSGNSTELFNRGVLTGYNLDDMNGNRDLVYRFQLFGPQYEVYYNYTNTTSAQCLNETLDFDWILTAVKGSEEIRDSFEKFNRYLDEQYEEQAKLRPRNTVTLRHP